MLLNSSHCNEYGMVFCSTKCQNWNNKSLQCNDCRAQQSEQHYYSLFLIHKSQGFLYKSQDVQNYKCFMNPSIQDPGVAVMSVQYTRQAYHQHICICPLFACWDICGHAKQMVNCNTMLCSEAVLLLMLITVTRVKHSSAFVCISMHPCVCLFVCTIKTKTAETTITKLYILSPPYPFNIREKGQRVNKWKKNIEGDWEAGVRKCTQSSALFT